jgi:hypothetical protein
MGCEVREWEFDGVQSQVILCGSGINPKPKKCAFCGCKNAKALCDWPMEKEKCVMAKTLRVGDTWVTQMAHKFAKIAEIEPLDARGFITDDVFVKLRFWVAIPHHKAPYPYMRLNDDLVMTVRPGTCDKPCCFRHRRHPAPNVDFCMDHWKEHGSEFLAAQNSEGFSERERGIYRTFGSYREERQHIAIEKAMEKRRSKQ